MKATKTSLTLLCCLLFTVASYAQDTVVVRDLETWASFGVKRDLGDNFTVSLEQQFRTWYNSSQLDQSFTEIGLKAKLAKRVHFGLGYRLITDRDRTPGEDGIIWDKEQRWNFDAEFGKKIERFTMEYRMRFTRSDTRGITTDEGDEAQWMWRNKIGVQYNIKGIKHTPYFDTELFRSIEDDGAGYYSKLRFTVGSRYKFNKVHRIKFFYRLERDLNTAYAATTHITGLSYYFKWK